MPTEESSPFGDHRGGYWIETDNCLLVNSCIYVRFRKIEKTLALGGFHS